MKYKPVKERTAVSMKSALRWILPRLGNTPLAAVDSLALRDLVSQMADAGFKPKTILNYSALVKLVVGSALDKNGKQALSARVESRVY